jgi:hypothetical protein
MGSLDTSPLHDNVETIDQLKIYYDPVRILYLARVYMCI